jgi:hypothetical protein
LGVRCSWYKMQPVHVPWLIVSLCLWVLVVLPVVALCVSVKRIDEQLAHDHDG